MYGLNAFMSIIKCFLVNALRYCFNTTSKMIGQREILNWEHWYMLGPLLSYVMLVALTFTLLVCAHIEIQSNIVVVFFQGIQCIANTKIFGSEKSYFITGNKFLIIITLQKSAGNRIEDFSTIVHHASLMVMPNFNVHRSLNWWLNISKNLLPVNKTSAQHTD